MREGSRSTGVLVGAVVAALRHHDPEVNAAVALSAARHAGDGVVGFDLAGDELLIRSLSLIAKPSLSRGPLVSASRAMPPRRPRAAPPGGR